MYGFPDTTDLRLLKKSQKFPSNAICGRSNIVLSEYNKDVVSCELTHTLSERTLPSVNCEGNVKTVFVIEIEVKRANYNRDMIAKIADAMKGSKVIFIVKFEDSCQVLINHEGHPIRSAWEKNLTFLLQGHTLDAIWENIVAIVGQINVEQGYTLIQQIKVNELKAKLDKEIANLEKKTRAEKQPARQRALFQQLQALKADYQHKIEELVATF